MEKNLDRFQFRGWNGKRMSYNWDWNTTAEGMGICLIDWLASGNTIMQSTGLKDKNGTLIFEGDMLKIKLNRTKNHIFEIIWNNQLACFDYQPKPCTESLILYLNEAEIIGNRFQNPELLEKQ